MLKCNEGQISNTDFCRDQGAPEFQSGVTGLSVPILQIMVVLFLALG